MNQTLVCTIPKVVNQYKIEIGTGLLDKQTDYLKTLGSRFAIITDNILAPLYGQQLSKSLIESGLETHLFSFSEGESNKTRITKEWLEDQLLAQGLGRDTCIIALGGGVVTDIAGYVAATYCRGLPLVMIPTSLLGMVDASIGGKTGVNTPYGKNMIGCIYQPKKVIIDISTLKTLPKKELSYGVVEIIKHGLIADSALFDTLEKHSEQVLKLDPQILGQIIFESCRIKKEIVEEDEKETGKRHLLNFGHTIGHALERLSDYKLAHGQAVAIGIIVESYLSLSLNILDQDSFNRIKRIFKSYLLPMRFPSNFSLMGILDVLALDKKSIQGIPRFILLKAVGHPLISNGNYCHIVSKSLIEKAIDWMHNDLCRD
jgi:3-dehydroquinate synthase